MNLDNKTLNKNKLIRESGIELLKIVAIILIVVSHVVQTLSSKFSHLSYDDYYISFEFAKNDLSYIFLTFLRYSGCFGNLIFFVCSAWFLVESKKINVQKIFFMLLEIWFISVVILSISVFILRDQISFKMIYKALFPTTFALNWYLTCYILFYSIHTLLNKIIESISKQSHFRLCLVLSFLYIFVNTILSAFLYNDLFLFITIYFCVAYEKKYLSKFSSNIKLNFFIFFISITGLFILHCLTNFLGLHINFFKNKTLYWLRNCNFFLVFAAICLKNIALHYKFKNGFINYISSLSLLIYIIHENIFVRAFLRPFIWQKLYLNFGYSRIFVLIFIFAVSLFILSAIISSIYKFSIQRVIKKISLLFYKSFRNLYLKLESKL